MDDIETLTDAERVTLEGTAMDSALLHGERVARKALRIIDAQAERLIKLEARIQLLESDAHFYTRKLDRLDALARQWTNEDADQESEVDDAEDQAEADGEDQTEEMTTLECGEALADILGGYRERVARRRAEDGTPV